MIRISLRSSSQITQIVGSTYDGALNGASPFSLFPLAAPFLTQTAASHLLGDTSLQQSLTSTAAASSSATPSLLSAAGNSSPVVVPVSIGESALQSAVKLPQPHMEITTAENQLVEINTH